MPTRTREDISLPTGFLPNFCDSRMLFLVVLIAQLLAFILALAPDSSTYGFWVSLALISLFVQWIALGSILTLCLTRSLLMPLKAAYSALAAWLIMLGITLLFSVLAAGIGGRIGLLPPEAALPNPEFLIRNLAIGAIVSAVALRYFYVQHQWKQNVEAEARSRIQALQARIRPHFLFNSMNTIASLTRTRPDVAETAVEDLADLFRATLADRDTLMLREELDLVHRYLRIEALRLGERLKVEWRMDENLPEDYPMPGLILQPLVENAIYHGIEPLTEGGVVTIELRLSAQALHIEVTNPMPSELHRRRRPGNRIAQENIRQRLELAFRGSASWAAQSEGERYRVHITLPRRTES